MQNVQQLYQKLNAERSATPELISFRTIRRSVGVLGMTLPFTLWLGSALFANNAGLQPSVSHYYYTNMREWFTGVLCAVSLFLFTYKGHNLMDGISANIAAISALLVAFFPTNFIENYPGQQQVASVFNTPHHNAIHLAAAAVFFLTLAFMALKLFTRSNRPASEWSPKKKSRNIIYKVCGWLMITCLVVIAISKPVLGVSKESPLTFGLEAVALMAFGLSWLVKGETLYKD